MHFIDYGAKVFLFFWDTWPCIYTPLFNLSLYDIAEFRNNSTVQCSFINNISVFSIVNVRNLRAAFSAAEGKMSEIFAKAVFANYKHDESRRKI